MAPVDSPSPDLTVRHRPVQERGRVRFDAILTAARELLAESGVEGFTIDDVAAPEGSDEDGVMWEEPPAATAATALQPAQNMTDAEQSSPPPPSPAQVVRPPSPVPQAIDEGERQAALDEMRASLEAEGLALRREQRRAAQQSEGVTAETYADVQELLDDVESRRPLRMTIAHLVATTGRMRNERHGHAADRLAVTLDGRAGV